MLSAIRDADAMVCAAERWRAIRVSVLERRQMRAVRQQPDYKCTAQNGLATRS